MSKLSDVVKSNQTNEDFSNNVRLPFFKAADGKTKVIFLSQEEDSDDGIPSIEIYRSYKLPAFPYERAYEDGDKLDPEYLRKLSKEGKSPNTSRFSHKGFAYIFNLTAYNAKKVLENKDALTKNDFNKDLNETKAAKSYVKDERYDNFEGFMKYNFNTTVVEALLEYKKMAKDEGDEDGFRTYIFDLVKSGTGLDTSYSLTPSIPYEDLDNDIQDHIESFISENVFGSFDYLIERKRYMPGDSIPEETSFTGMSLETDSKEEDDDLDSTWD